MTKIEELIQAVERGKPSGELRLWYLGDARDCVCSNFWLPGFGEAARLEEALIRHGWVIETKGGAE